MYDASEGAEMNDLYYGELVEARQAEMRAEAARSRLRALVSCCRPAQWRTVALRVATGVREWFRRGQLGPVEGTCTTC